jgi:2-dehydro-3-deoxygalactonokinase
MANDAAWIAVDWGTSNLRLWGVADDGSIAFARDSHDGMGKLTPDKYPGVLSGLLADTGSSATEILVCGMAGARQGWHEAPYLDTPADLGRLADGAVTPATAPVGLTVRILPGVCQRDTGAEDVMRGEETQLLGLRALLPSFSGLVVMPGTHSKWAMLDGNRLTRFASAMTGEVFEVLKTHSVLRHSFAGELDPAEREIGFDAGLTHGLEHPERLTGMLFKTRAAALLSGRTPGWCAGYLSGLLIGAEIGGLRDWAETPAAGAEIPLVGGGALCALYARAFARIGHATRIVDATDATLAGLKAARNAH